MSKGRFILTGIMFAVIATGCDDRPEGVLSESRMADVVSDLYLADGYSSTVTPMMTDSAKKSLRREVLREHGLTDKEYKKSLDWYARNMDDYDKILEKAYSNLIDQQKDLVGDYASSHDNMSALWPYRPMAMISPLASSYDFRFSIPVENDKINKGDRLELSLIPASSSDMDVMLAVDYTDGGASYVTRRGNPHRKVTLKLQTDTSRTVKRIFGMITPAGRIQRPEWIDSLELVSLPFIEENYYLLYSQKGYDVRKKNPKVKENRIEKDTVISRASDRSIPLNDVTSAEDRMIERTQVSRSSEAKQEMLSK